MRKNRSQEQPIRRMREGRNKQPTATTINNKYTITITAKNQNPLTRV